MLSDWFEGGRRKYTLGGGGRIDRMSMSYYYGEGGFYAKDERKLSPFIIVIRTNNYVITLFTNFIL